MPKKYTAKKFQSTNTQPFENFPNFHGQLTKEMRNDPMKFFGVHRFLKKEMEAEYGKANFHVTTGSGNRKFATWVFELTYCNVYVLTHQEKGTIFEVEVSGNYPEAVKEMWDFYEDFAEKFKRKIAK